MRYHIHRWTVLLLLLLVAGCAQFGLAEPESFSEKLAYSYSQNEALRLSAAQSLKAGTISKTDAQQVLTTTDTARTALDEARRLNGAGDVSSALGKLQLATGLLTSIQTFLQSKGIK